MQYIGGKYRIAKELAATFGRIDGGYWEPFVGAGNVIQYVDADFLIGSDVDPHIINMLQAVQYGWVPPVCCTKSDYQTVRELVPLISSEYVLKGYIGYQCSFGGKFFGGYANDPSSSRNYSLNGRRSIERIYNHAATVDFLISDFFSMSVPKGVTTIYCDPPYSGTTKVGSGTYFNTDAFWKRCIKLSNNYKVYVTEFQAPKGWKATKQWLKSGGLRDKTGSSKMPETLWERA